MSTSIETIISKLNDLIELDFDAIEAYQAAIERLTNADSKARLTEFLADHQRHTRNLTGCVTRLGGQAAQGPDFKRYLTKGKVVIADMVGEDHAMLANEEVTNKRYEVALSANSDMDVETRKTIEANLGDERRQRAWIDQQTEREKK